MPFGFFAIVSTEKVFEIESKQLKTKWFIWKEIKRKVKRTH